MHNLSFALIGMIVLLAACSFPTSEEAGLRYPTTPAVDVPDEPDWKEVGMAKELINAKEKLVVISGGSNPVPLSEWDQLEVRLPWQKNADRHMLIDQTVLLRSPDASPDCQGNDCLTERSYQGYSWIELAQPLAVDFIPSKTDMMKPEKGHLSVKVIKKCQIIRYDREIYQLTDNKGNFYAMHATETGAPELDVVLPEGWTLQRVSLDEPLIIAPFGEKGDCYFNIVGDHLGQGYHQYRYAGAYYPE